MDTDEKGYKRLHPTPLRKNLTKAGFALCFAASWAILMWDSYTVKGSHAGWVFAALVWSHIFLSKLDLWSSVRTSDSIFKAWGESNDRWAAFANALSSEKVELKMQNDHLQSQARVN